MSVLAPEDTIALATFVTVVAVGLGIELARSAMADSPRARIRQRLHDSVSDVAPAVAAETPAEDDIAVRPRRAGDAGPLAQMLHRMKEQVEHMGGGGGLRAIALAAGAAAAAVPVGAQVAGLGLLVGLLAAPVAAVGAAYGCYGFFIRRYRARFLAGLPDALDLMIRAVRAGVPVVHAIITAGKELPDPVGREFRIMGDALRLGMDQQEVMEAASKRIGIADFRFFVVCLQLQRETGGPLADTLDNLAGIIRARREVGLKTRALTAQGRAASKIIAAVPVCVVLALKTMGAGYLDVLFDTARGQRLLALAIGMIVTGLVAINRMSKLED